MIQKHLQSVQIVWMMFEIVLMIKNHQGKKLIVFNCLII